MSNILIASPNRVDGTGTYAGGSWMAALPASNVGNSSLGKLARSSNAQRASTRMRLKLASACKLRAVALVAHNMSAGARFRVRAGTAPLDLLFDDPTQKDSRVTFSGGDNGTVIDKKGRIVRVTRTNLLLQSEALTSGTWSNSAATVTANAPYIATPFDPTAATAVSLVVPSAAASPHYVSQNFTPTESGPHAVSVFARSKGYANFAIEVLGVGYAYFDAGALEVTTSSTVSDSSIDPAASGWCRATIVVNLTAGTTYTANFYSAPARNNAGAAGDGASGTYLFGAQAERNAVATDYIKTTAATVTATASGRIGYSATNLAAGTATQTIAGVTPGTYALVVDGVGASVVASGANVKNGSSAPATPGLPANVEVTATGAVTLDVSGAPAALHLRECLGLLGEEARTNMLSYSEQFDNAVWGSTDTGYVLSANSVVAPDGTMSADAYTRGNTTAFAYLRQTMTGDASQALTFSIWAKAGDANISFGLTISDVSATSLSSSVLALSATWQRFSFTVAAGALANTGSIGVGLSPSVSLGQTVHLWGAQIEVGSTVSSYVPTASAGVARVADGAVVSGANFSGVYNAAQGTLYVENNFNGGSDVLASNRVAVGIYRTSVDYLAIVYNRDGAHDGAYVQTAGGAGIWAADGPAPTASFAKAAFTYKAGAFSLTNDGSAPQTYSGATDPMPAATQMNIGPALNGYVKRITYWPQRLTNSQLQTITTSGPDALGANTGWLDAMQLTFQGDTPSDWGTRYAAIAMLSDADLQAQYLTLEIDDTANSSGYVQIGRLFAGAGLQPAFNASREGFADGRDEKSTALETPSGVRFGTERRRPRVVRFALKYLTQDEADRIHEMQDDVGTLDEVLYVSDPANLAASQRYGFLGYMRTLGAIDFPYPLTRAIPFEIAEKL